MQKILVTGGRGFFASRFVDFYKDRYDILAPGHQELDVTDEESVKRTVDKFQPELILHTAAVASTSYCEAHPAMAHHINVDGAVYMGHAAKESGAKMIFISTEQVFNGNENPGPYDESMAAVPDTVYGQTKLEAERMLEAVVPELWIPRFTWLFGLPQRGCGMSSEILWGSVQSIMRREPIKASKHEFRGMTYVQEMVGNILKLIELPYGIYNMGASNEESRYAVVREIIESLGLGARLPELLVEDKDRYMERPRDIRLDMRKAREQGIVFTDTADAIRKCIAEYKFIC